MDDINFDELDKAVNSALKTDDTSEQATKTDSVSTEPMQSLQSSPVEPTTPTPVVSAAQVTPVATPQKRRGQFMDFVRTAPSDQGVPASRRQAPKVAPLSPAVVETTASGEAPEVTESPIVKQEATSEEAPLQNVPDSGVYGAPAPTHDWPDPLEMANAKAVLPEVPEVVDTKVEPAEITSDDQEDSSQFSTVQASPFLEGTEVEKRPLGAFADSKEDITSGSLVTDQIDSTSSAAIQPEIVSVEADEPKEVLAAAANLPVESESEVATPAVPAGNGSIPQQYHPVAAEVNRENVEEHPVFDTKEYHQPLPPATKQHSAGVFKYILIGLLMLLLGAVGGYLLYVFKLI